MEKQFSGLTGLAILIIMVVMTVFGILATFGDSVLTFMKSGTGTILTGLSIIYVVMYPAILEVKEESNETLLLTFFYISLVVITLFFYTASKTQF